MTTILSTGALVSDARERIFTDIIAERDRQDAKWEPRQRHPDGTGEQYKWKADEAREFCQLADKMNAVTWMDILREEFWEAMAESVPGRLRVELIQMIAVATNWIEHLDREASG